MGDRVAERGADSMFDVDLEAQGIGSTMNAILNGPRSREFP